MPVSNSGLSGRRSKALRGAVVAALCGLSAGASPVLAADDPLIRLAQGEAAPAAPADLRVTEEGEAIGEGSNATGPAPTAGETQAQERSASAPDPETLLGVDINTIMPGTIAGGPEIVVPPMDRAAAEAGMDYFNSMNCIGCHAPNGSGGMGPSLSNDVYIYGDEPAEIFLTIKQGRPNGMPSYGRMIPDAALWQLVAYVKSIGADPDANRWGTTVSLDAMTIEQVPAEYQDTVEPWSKTKPFSFGEAPYKNAEPPRRETAAPAPGGETR
ncbi:c-type cytochrome [Fulvimarina sp. 2208YS6-2-32]|uniref:C-type cytochrome n=1 Tax=Fulvimarina uroteuthidis TaxID=3098149 RepID=A0ABU5I532_9HYPH|nr:c-type cytochrome [Fulvimarina sp. 2208YS6-2-32]MDY8109266.1 c-type cytochrome [Fulvimarina sp. 2208YS6-2-32]